MCEVLEPISMHKNTTWILLCHYSSMHFNSYSSTWYLSYIKLIILSPNLDLTWLLIFSCGPTLHSIQMDFRDSLWLVGHYGNASSLENWTWCANMG